jgi:hypothetical protein
MPEDQPAIALDGQDPVSEADAEAELEALRAQLLALQEEREAVETLAAKLQEADARAEQLHAELANARAAQLAAYRRAVLAEHRGQLVEELVGGNSPEAIDASVEAARVAYERIAGQLRQSGAGGPVVVPAGASPRGELGLDQLSPFEKIAGALARNGRG